MHLRLLLLLCLFGTAACATLACSGGDGGDGGRTVTFASGMVMASQGGVVGEMDSAHIDIPAGALASDTMIEVRPGDASELPDGATGAGPVMRAEPNGLTFQRPATVAVPVDPAMVADGKRLEDLVVYRRQSNGSVRTIPVVGYDDKRMLLYAATTGFSVFQAAVPDGEFQIVPRNSFFTEISTAVRIELEHTRGQDVVDYEIVEAMKVEGIGENDLPLEENEVAPGVVLSNRGVISGSARELGVFAFTLRATSASVTNPASSTISLTMTVVRREETGFEDAATQDLLQYEYDDDNNLYAIGRKGGVDSLIRIPDDPMEPIQTRSINFGLHPNLAVSPDGEAIVIAYEEPVRVSLDFSVWDLRQALKDLNANGVIEGIPFDVVGDQQPDVVVNLELEEGETFNASATQVQALADALNDEFMRMDLNVRAVAYGTFEGLSIQDNRELYVASQSSVPFPALMIGGESFGATPEIDSGGEAINQQIWVEEYDRNLMPIGPAQRIDRDVRWTGNDDPSLTAFAREARRPIVAFAHDHGVEPEVDEEGNPVPIRRIYAVVYEQMRNLATVSGSLRSDIYMVWREWGGMTLSDEVRLDTTDLAGQSAGDGIAIAGTEAGVTIAWTERGGDNAGTNGTDSQGNLLYGSPGDVMMLVIDKPDLPPLPGPDDDPEEIEPIEIPIDVMVPEPIAVNDEAATTGRFPALEASRSNEIYIAWSERDDAPAPPGPDPTVNTNTSGFASQTSRIITRRELALRVAPVTGMGVGTSWLVKDAPLESSIYSASLAISSEGEVAVAWVEAFFNGQQGTYLRRFRSTGTPMENSVQVSIGDRPLIAYDAKDVLAMGFYSGGTVTSFRFAELPPEVDDDEEE